MACVVTGREHELQEISRQSAGFPGGAQVTRWCRNCGGVVVDVDVDGRVDPGAAMKMRFPRLALEQAETRSQASR